MNGTKSRQITRDSLFVMADMRIGDGDEEHRIKLRNLSSGGMMGEGTVRVARGDRVSVNIRNVGWTEGTVAWVQENRFGVAFAEEIDAKVVRAPAPAAVTDTFIPRRPIQSVPKGAAIRKI